MTDAFSLLSKHLDNALEQQKKEIFSVLETKIPAMNSSNTSKTEFKFKYTSNQKQCGVSDKVSQDISAIKTAIVADNRELAIKTVDKVQIDIVVRNKTAKIGENTAGTRSMNMKGVHWLMILTISVISDRLKPGLFTNAKLPLPRNHPNVWRRTSFFAVWNPIYT
jgi:hypothetical protein